MRMSDWSSDVCSSDLILAANGVEIPVSCEQGICGTCVTRVLHGEPDHRDLFMTDEEHAANDQFTPCCSRARSEEHTSELQSLMRTSYAVFCLQKKTHKTHQYVQYQTHETSTYQK